MPKSCRNNSVPKKHLLDKIKTKSNKKPCDIYLPSEIYDIIVSHIKSPTELNNITCVSKQWKTIYQKYVDNLVYNMKWTLSIMPTKKVNSSLRHSGSRIIAVRFGKYAPHKSSFFTATGTSYII